MSIEFDTEKSRRNLEIRGFDFSLAEDFEWDSAIIREDRRKNYGEKRFLALGFIGLRLFHITYTVRKGRYRIISLRKANKREAKLYDEKTGPGTG